MMYSLIKQKKNCQICEKSFANGKALGGHMRSHYQKLPVQCRGPVSDSSTVPMMPLPQTSKKLGANFTPRETVLVRSVHSSEVVASPKSNPTESLEEVQIASYLAELSKRTNSPKKAVMNRLESTRKGKYTEKNNKVNCEYDDEESYYRYLDEDDDDNKDGDVKFLTSDVRTVAEDKDTDDNNNRTYFVAREQKRKKQNEHMCDICGKVLLSYQALGGHRTSHTNKRLKVSDQAGKPAKGTLIRRHFECQICGRVFESGQALGGHKKAHFVFLKPIN